MGSHIDSLTIMGDKSILERYREEVMAGKETFRYKGKSGTQGRRGPGIHHVSLRIKIGRAGET